MITKLDNKYLILNWESINKYLNNSEMRSLDMIIKKISIGRARDGKIVKKYVVVSETFPIFKDTTQLILDYINDKNYTPVTEDMIQKRINEAVTKATTKIATRKISVTKENKSKEETNVKNKS